MVTPHDGIIDGIVREAEGRVGSDGALPFDRVVSVMAAYHREEYAQGVEQIEQGKDIIKALEDVNETLKNNGNGKKRKRDKAKAFAIPGAVGTILITEFLRIAGTL